MTINTGRLRGKRLGLLWILAEIFHIMLKPQGPVLLSGRCGPWWETTVAAPPDDPPALGREKLAQPQPGRSSPQAPGLGVTFHHISYWIQAGRGEEKPPGCQRAATARWSWGIVAWGWSLVWGSRNHHLQQAVWVGASLPNIPGRKGGALQPSCKADFRLFRVRTRDAILLQNINLSRSRQPLQADKILLLRGFSLSHESTSMMFSDVLDLRALKPSKTVASNGSESQAANAY